MSLGSLLFAAALAAEPVVIDDAAAPTYVIANGQGHATLLLNAEHGAPAAVDALVLAAGASVPLHKHDGSAEILVITKGRVTMTIGGKPFAAGPGDAVFIPADVEHDATVVEDLTAVQIYVGPGPEQRFTTGARVPRD